jgi:hypothetical protein
MSFAHASHWSAALRLAGQRLDLRLDFAHGVAGFLHAVSSPFSCAASC